MACSERPIVKPPLACRQTTSPPLPRLVGTNAPTGSFDAENGDGILRMSRVNRAILWAEHAFQITADGGSNHDAGEGPSDQEREVVDSLRAVARLVGPAMLYLGAQQCIGDVQESMHTTLLALSNDSSSSGCCRPPVDLKCTRAVLMALQELKRGPGAQQKVTPAVPKPTKSSKNTQVYGL